MRPGLTAPRKSVTDEPRNRIGSFDERIRPQFSAWAGATRLASSSDSAVSRPRRKIMANRATGGASSDVEVDVEGLAGIRDLLIGEAIGSVIAHHGFVVDHGGSRRFARADRIGVGDLDHLRLHQKRSV